MLAGTVCSRSLVLTKDENAKITTSDDYDLKVILPLHTTNVLPSAGERSLVRAAVLRGMFEGFRAQGLDVPSHSERCETVPTRTGGHNKFPIGTRRTAWNIPFFPVESFGSHLLGCQTAKIINRMGRRRGQAAGAFRDF